MLPVDANKSFDIGESKDGGGGGGGGGGGTKQFNGGGGGMFEVWKVWIDGVILFSWAILLILADSFKSWNFFYNIYNCL